MKHLLLELASRFFLAVDRLRCRRYIRGWQAYFRRELQKALAGFVNQMGVSASLRLTEQEKVSVCKLWREKVGVAPDLTYYALLKVALGRSPDAHYVSDDLYYSHILPFLNPLDESRVLEDKSKYAFWFRDVERPRELVRMIRGQGYWSGDNERISEEDAVRAVVAFGKPIIMKPTIDSLCGRGITVLSSYSQADVLQALHSYGADFVVQEVVVQSPEMAQFNQSSLNTFRITSLHLNGRVSILSSIVRVGKQGSVVDNVGAGGYAVGVGNDGTVKECGYTAKGDVVRQTYGGKLLSNIRLDGYEKVKSSALKLHSWMPYVPLIGWDLAIREDGQVILIEMNASTPSVWFEQLCTGPLFGDRFDEVVRYVLCHRLEHAGRQIATWRPDSRFYNLNKLLDGYAGGEKI